MPGVQLLARTGRERGAVAHWITVMGSVSSPPAGDAWPDCIVQSGTTLFGCFAACLTESFSTLSEGLRHSWKPGSRPTGAGSAQREGAGNARGPPKSPRGGEAKARVEVERGGRGRARTSRTAARRGPRSRRGWGARPSGKVPEQCRVRIPERSTLHDSLRPGRKAAAEGQQRPRVEHVDKHVLNVLLVPGRDRRGAVAVPPRVPDGVVLLRPVAVGGASPGGGRAGARGPAAAEVGLGDAPEASRPLSVSLWGRPACGRTGVRLADGTRIRWREGAWSVTPERGCRFLANAL